ncbi:MAG: DUF2130 domain-containing protein, partial [Verrucomicrobiales bacterium]|nr:DUF2130 domain-containing protein [Verrucomicrobiales bacterium]
MADTNITCPKCGAEIPLSEAVSHRLREDLNADFERRRQQLNAALEEREKKLVNAQAALESRAAGVQAEVGRALEAERQRLLTEAAHQAEEKLGVQLKDLRRQLDDRQARLKAAEKTELDLLKQQRELEEARQAMELEVARKLEAERRRIADAARQQGVEAERLKLAEKEQAIKGLQEQIAALKQRAEQGSMQLQGEALELTLENDLQQSFPFDELAEVKKGTRGADVTQTVRTNNGTPCGAILWEAKNARNWSPAWITKLKEDQRQARADLAVLVATCPPEGIRGIGQLDGVWVCEPPFAVALGMALRQGLTTTAMQRIQQAGRADKATALHEHLCGVEFRQHIAAVVESFVGLRDQLCARSSCEKPPRSR